MMVMQFLVSALTNRVRLSTKNTYKILRPLRKVGMGVYFKISTSWLVLLERSFICMIKM